MFFILLDEGTYLASESSFYRILRAHDEVRERRRQATHPARVRPELVADRPLVVWSWDITKLKGPKRGDYYDLYVVIDIFSRYVVAWCVAPDRVAASWPRNSSPTPWPATTSARPAHHPRRSGHVDDLEPGGASCSPSWASDAATAAPIVSNDNPYSEAQFKTLKYCPAFPERFGSIEDARAFCEAFFAYYNHDHRHSGIGYHTPASVHYGTATEVRAQRAETLDAAYAANPARFRHRRPDRRSCPTVAWINEPVPVEEIAKLPHKNVSQIA